MGKIKILRLTDTERFLLEAGFRNDDYHCFRMRCRAVLLKSKGLSSQDIGLQTDMSHISVNFWVKRFEEFGIDGLSTRPGRAQAYNGLLRRTSRSQGHRTGQAECKQSQGSFAERDRKRGEQLDF